MADLQSIIIGSLIIIAGFGGVLSSAFVAPGSSFDDNYPIGDAWAASGTHFNTFSDADGSLVIDNVSQGSGYFVSDVINNSGSLEIERIDFTASNVAPNQDRVIELTVRGLVNGSIEGVRTYTIEENGFNSIPTENLSERRFDSYEFRIDLTTGGSTSPELDSLSVQGQSYPEDDPLSMAFMVFMLFLGLYTILDL